MTERAAMNMCEPGAAHCGGAHEPDRTGVNAISEVRPDPHSAGLLG